MTYQVNLLNTSEEMLLGLINHDNNPDNIPHQDLWPKVEAIDIDNVVLGSRYIAPAHPWSVTPEGKAVDMLVKKAIAFETNVCKVVIRGDNSTRIFIDGVSYAGNRNKEHEATVEIPVKIGIRTLSIWVVNTETTGGVTFSIYDGDTLREVSDETWGFVTPIENKVVKERYVKKGWRELKEEDVLYIRPPVSVPSGDYANNGRLEVDAIGLEPALSNCAYQTWPAADIYPGDPTSGTSYHRSHPTAKYVYSLPHHMLLKSNEYCMFVRVVNCPTGKLKIDASIDDNAEFYVDGVKVDHSFNAVLSSVTIDVSPGYRKIGVKVIEGPGLSPWHANWAIWDNGSLVAVSDASWKYAVSASPSINDKVAHLSNTIRPGFTNTFTLTSDSGAIANPSKTQVTSPDGTVVETYHLPMQNTNWDWLSKSTNKNPPKNTITTVVTTGDDFDVEEVPVKYNRIGLDALFSLTGIEIREINLDVNPDGSIVLNQRVLNDINRRYGVNFVMADFILSHDKDGYHIAASENSVAFNSETMFNVLRSLTTRVPNTTLVGFLEDNVQ